MGTATVALVGDSGNALIDSLVWGTRWVSVGAGPTAITVGHAPGATAAELSAISVALCCVEAVANVDFQWMGVDTNRDADIRFVMEPGPSGGQLGQGFAPGEIWYGPAWNPDLSDVYVFTSSFTGGLTPGNFDFMTFLHELGHAMGLAHPHDQGGTFLDPSPLMPGVSEGQGFGDFGDFNLNQGIFTAMSYNWGWPVGGLPGNPSGLMALDIMALQYIYGANPDFAGGDDAYELPRRGGGFSCIWDTGGEDTISVQGSRAAIVDLRAATGLVAEGGGGFVSFVQGGQGGFTIAAGVIIENAIGGRGADTIVGNAAANRLTGGLGADHLIGGDGEDLFIFTRLQDSGVPSARADRISDFMTGCDVIDLSLIDANRLLRGSQAFVWGGEGTAFSSAGEVRFEVVNGETHILINVDGDQRPEAMIVLDGVVGLTDSDFIF